MENKTYFASLYGQEPAKRQLSFLIESQHKNGITGNLIFCAKRGEGKTEFAREFARNLLNPDTKRPKPLIEFNATGIKSTDAFIKDIAIPHLINTHATVFVDEAHEINKKLMNSFLTILSPNRENRNILHWEGAPIEFNFYFLTFLFATTNPEKLSKPFMDRLERIELEPYKTTELILILKRNLNYINKNLTIEKGLAPEIATVLRQSPRRTVIMANKIGQYCNTNNITKFAIEDWKKLKRTLNIKPLGLQVIEIQELRALRQSNSTLTHIASKLGLDSTTVRRDIESYLLANDLIAIDGKRVLTVKGRSVLKEIDESEGDN